MVQLDDIVLALCRGVIKAVMMAGQVVGMPLRLVLVMAAIMVMVCGQVDMC